MGATVIKSTRCPKRMYFAEVATLHMMRLDPTCRCLSGRRFECEVTGDLYTLRSHRRFDNHLDKCASQITVTSS